MKPVDAAIKGVREMCAPVTMAVLTTIFAFMPLLIYLWHFREVYSRNPNGGDSRTGFLIGRGVADPAGSFVRWQAAGLSKRSFRACW